MLLYQWRNHFVYYIQRQLVNKKNKIKNTVGFKDENNVLHLGVRLYLDQGDFVKFKVDDKGYSMFEHFSELILKFDKEYSNFK